MSSLKYSLRNDCNEPLDIEAQRRDRIEENKRRLLELGLLQAQKQISDAVRDSKKSQEPRKRQPSNLGAFIAKEFQYEPRRSGRVQSLPAKVYNMDYIFRDMSADDTRLSKDGSSKRLRLLERGNSSRVTRNNDGWQPWMGIASFKAADKAKEAAHALLTELQQKGVQACIKEMSDSQVSGGFWCQLPMGFCGQFQMTKRTMRLHYGDEATEVVFLPRPGGGGGLSGGWRTFAILQVLFPNDAVVFEKVDEQQLRAHLFRAYDYDPTWVKADRPTEACNHMSASLSTSVMNDRDECGIGGTSDSNPSSNDMIQQQQEENEAFGLENTAVVTQREGGRKLGLLSEEGRRGSEADTLALQTETDRGTEKIKTGQRGCMPLKKTVSRQQTPVSLEIKHCGANAEGINANASVHVNKKKTIKQEKSVKMSKKKPLPPLDGKNEFYVDRVMQYTREDNLDFFLIRWWGYGSEDDTWETISAFSNAPGSYTWECPMPEQFRIGG